MTSDIYDPFAKEAALRAESESWDTSQFQEATEEDVPILDFGPYFESGKPSEKEQLANKLYKVSTENGFFALKGHGIPKTALRTVFEQSMSFHDLPYSMKEEIRMDQAEHPVKGVGFLPFNNRKLPSRKKGNANEAFIIKRQITKQQQITLNDNLWPKDSVLPHFKTVVIEYARLMEELALSMLPIYSAALKLHADFFNDAFSSPMYRLRLTKYPPIKKSSSDDLGIGPHVDTSFLTILAQDGTGLIIFSEKKQKWLLAPYYEDMFIVNTGELLRQWTNDTFISVKHFAVNNFGDKPRYSIPFFVNATADYRMSCIPTCSSESNPPKYPPFSYIESQASVQGE